MEREQGGEYGKSTGLQAVHEETSVVSAETSPATDYLVGVCGTLVVSPVTNIMAVGVAAIVSMIGLFIADLIRIRTHSNSRGNSNSDKRR
jgi:hypothetical protein